MTGARRPKILCLIPGAPLPANSGGALRTLSIVRALDRNFDLSVLGWERPGEDGCGFARMLDGSVDLVHRARIAATLIREGVGVFSGLPAGYTRYLWPAAVLRQHLASTRFDAIHFDHPHTALCWPLVRRLQPQAALVLDTHNVEAEIAEQLSTSARGLRRKALAWHATRIRALESEVARNVDLVVACSERDARVFEALGARRVCVVPNPAPPLTHAAVTPRRDLVFIGSFDWRPNEDAAVELARRIWPRCRAQLPGARLVLAGRNPPRSVLSLASRDVLVHGSVESVQPFLDGAFATAIPVRAGSGTRIKILEAWAAGVPVIATRTAADGLPYLDGTDLLLAEDPDEFAGAVVKLWNDPSLADRLIVQAKQTVMPFAPERVSELIVRRYRDELGLSAGPFTAHAAAEPERRESQPRYATGR
jgi:glycosyltransferase involved in cell wall biosynthesis